MKLTVFIFLCISGSLLFAQNTSEREWTIFQKGVQEYKAGRYKKAAHDFELVIAKIKDSSLITAHHLMLAKSYYKSGDYEASIRSCNNFLKAYPDSKYKPHIRYLIANNYYRLNRLQSAVQTWLSVAARKQDKTLSDKSIKLADEAVRYLLDEQGLSYLKGQVKEDFSKQFILYHMAEKDYEKGNFPPAIAMLEEAISIRGTNSIYESKARKLLNYLSDKKSNAIRIAALLPLSGNNSDLGQALLDGAQMAVDQFNRTQGPTLELIPFDYETRLTSALIQLKEIARDPTISAVFGPVENDIAAACAVAADYESIPLITPTASEKELRTLSASVVQLSIPMDITVQKLARYAQDSLQLKRFATIAPIDDYFVRMTGMFVQKQNQLENKVVAQEWYYPGNQDITSHFKALKRAGLKLVFQDSLTRVDSTLSRTSIDSLYKIYQQEQNEILKETHTTVDSADIPVKTINGLFMPVFTSDIGILASQHAYWNIQTQVLGNSDWYDLEALKKNQNYINGLIFVSDGYLNKESWDYRKFRNSFRDIYRRTPEKFELMGYDSFNFILSALEGSSEKISRKAFLSQLLAAPLYNGVYRNFEVGKKRFNDAARILKFTYGQILPLK